MVDKTAVRIHKTDRKKHPLTKQSMCCYLSEIGYITENYTHIVYTNQVCQPLARFKNDDNSNQVPWI